MGRINHPVHCPECGNLCYYGTIDDHQNYLYCCGKGCGKSWKDTDERITSQGDGKNEGIQVQKPVKT